MSRETPELPPVSVPAAQAPDPVAAARAAGLRHVDDRRPGLRRVHTGKALRRGRRRVPVFALRDAAGHAVRDAATLERVRKLAIPPAWRDVWICPLPEGHIQATGRDARGRKQYRYHPRWRQERDGTKFARMIAFARALPALRRRVAADLRRPGLPRAKVLATVVRLLETTFIRVGNDEYARSNGSFGLTTLEDRHVRFGRDGARFRFRGKSRVLHEVSIQDPRVARIVRRCRDLPGQELFQYLEDGRPATIDSADVNAYIREATGQDFTAKDFRTWAGTVLAAAALREVAAAQQATATATAARPSNRQVVRAIASVAARLGNTPTVCRKCYVHPDVIAAYLDGGLARASGRARGAPAAGTEAPSRGLRGEERAVLTLLRLRSRHPAPASLHVPHLRQHRGQRRRRSGHRGAGPHAHPVPARVGRA